MKRIFISKSVILTCFIVLSLANTPLAAQSENGDKHSNILGILTGDTEQASENLNTIKENWDDSYVTMLLEIAQFISDWGVLTELYALLDQKTGQKHGLDRNAWFEWVWNRDYTMPPDYADFKSNLYGLVFPAFKKYFSSSYTSKIRLDEVRWGGVVQDGIPPLRNPKMIDANDAKYLDDSNLVFGISINSDTRAYPKRILAWHEMFVDRIGDTATAGVYCTLCGTMILYKTELNGTNYNLGTSGFLYRSNKLMYDKKTQSLWNTFKGTPVIGQLAGKDISLEKGSVVTTTWGEWKKRHPDTKVLSLDTGYDKNYDEGEAYQSYFATDDLMFTVPKLDKRLKNKDEILGLIFPDQPGKALAISVKFLKKKSLYAGRLGDKDFVIFTDRSGASRVYESGGFNFSKWDNNNQITDSNGVKWELSESKIESSQGQILKRVPAHRAFWFGWFSQYSHTELKK